MSVPVLFALFAVAIGADANVLA
ncbi:hypothetical protein O9993_07855 [Vibrio lentus]|nr:hypothetical protein [Vibrio lentus]